MGGEWPKTGLEIKDKVGPNEKNNEYDVTIVQQLLTLRKYQVEVNGQFDDATAQAVAKFIADHPTPRGNKSAPYIEYNGNPAYNWRQLSGQWIPCSDNLTEEQKADTCLKTDVGRPADCCGQSTGETPKQDETPQPQPQTPDGEQPPQPETPENPETPEEPVSPTEMEDDDKTAIDRILEEFLKKEVTKTDGTALWERESSPFPVPFLSYGVVNTQVIFGAGLEGEFGLERQGVGLKGSAKLAFKVFIKLEAAMGFKGSIPQLGSVDWKLAVGGKGEVALEISTSASAEVQGNKLLLTYEPFTAELKFTPSVYIDFPDLPALDERPFLVALAAALKGELDGTSVVYPLGDLAILELTASAYTIAFEFDPQTLSFRRAEATPLTDFKFGFTDDFKKLLGEIQTVLTTPVNFIPNIGDMVKGAQDLVDDVGLGIQYTVDQAGNRFNEVREDLQERAEEIQQQVQEQVDQARQQVQNTVDQVRENIDQTRENIGEKVDEARQNVQNTVDQTRENIQNTVEEVQDQVGDAVDNAGNTLNDLKDRAGNFFNNITGRGDD